MARRIPALALIVTVLLIGVPGVCLACSCLVATDEEHFARADVVFTGHAVERRDANAGNPFQSSADPVHWTFDTGSVQKGAVDGDAVVSTPRNEASCGFTFVEGRRYQVFANRAEDGSLETGLCSGTRELAAGETPYVPAQQTPPPVPPAPTPTRAASPTPTTATPSASPPPLITPGPVATPQTTDAAPVADETDALPAVLALGGALAALAVAAALALRRPAS